MRKKAVLLVASLLLSLASIAHADIAAIHRAQLPADPAVLAAFDDAGKLEPYTRSLTASWQYPVARAEVAARLAKDLDTLTLAFKSYPTNRELLLLTSLVARYMCNLDVAGCQSAATRVLRQTQALDPADLRIAWFHAALLCQTRRPKAGADEFLSLESSHAPDQLPAAFWDDYIACAAATDMPAHIARAAGHLEKLRVPPSPSADALIRAARSRFAPYDRKGNYGVQELWQSANVGGNDQFTSTICGVRFRAHHGWKISRMAVSNGSCTAGFYTGPYNDGDSSLTASILLLVKQPEKNETLEDWAGKLAAKGAFEPFAPANCPSDRCVAMQGESGDRRGRLIVFGRSQPQFPGLAFEFPSDLPRSEFEKGSTFYRPGQTQQRIPGKLFYLVMLDTAASIEEPAVKDFDFFLENLTVE